MAGKRSSGSFRAVTHRTDKARNPSGQTWGEKEAGGIPMGKHIPVWAARTRALVTHEKTPQKFFSGISFQ